MSYNDYPSPYASLGPLVIPLNLFQGLVEASRALMARMVAERGGWIEPFLFVAL